MDNLTHGITGLGIAYLVQEIAGGPQGGLVACALVSSQLPDLDVIMGSKSKTAYLKHHRGFSHSILLAPFFAGITAGGFKLFFTQTSYWQLFLVSFLSLALHLLFDLLNAYGTKLLWPLSQRRFALDILMIIDPLMIFIFIFGLSLYILFDQKSLLFALYPLLALYILAMLNFQVKAKGYLRQVFAKEMELNLLPPLIGWRKWNFIIQGEEVFYLGQVDAFSGQIKVQEKLSKEEECLYVLATKDDPQVQAFLEFARFPWFTKGEQNNELIVKWSDLRYKLREKEHFAIEIKSILKP